MQLLQDVFIIEQLQVLNEGNQKDVMKIRGVFGRCNEKNNNGRVYPTAVVASQLEKVQPLIAERRLCGELDHPQNDTVKLSNASHLITKLDMKGDELIGEAEILKTPAGLTAKALVDGGVKIGISSRGMGTLSEDQNGDKIVNEDYRLVTFDLVADPSTRGAYPGLAESTESKFVRESQSKLKKEGTFVTLLNSKLRDAYQPWIEEAKEKTSPPVKDKVLDYAVEEADLRESKYGEALELVKADGHWHRIAEAILNGLREDGEEGKEGEETHRFAASVAERASKTLQNKVEANTRRLRRDTRRRAAIEHRINKKISKNKQKIAQKQSKKGGRRASDTQRIAASTSYKQLGVLITEGGYDADQFAAEREDAKDARRTGAVYKPEGFIRRGVRHRDERVQARRLRGDQNKQALKQAKRLPVAQAKGEGKAARRKAVDAARAVGGGERETQKQSTKTSRVTAQQVRRRAFEKGRIKAAPEGSTRSIGLGGRLRALGADVATKAAHPIRTYEKGRPSSQRTRPQSYRGEFKGRRSATVRQATRDRYQSGSIRKDNERGLPNATVVSPPSPKVGKKGLPDLPPGTERIAPAGKGAHPEPRAKQTSPVSQSGTGINPDLQRRFNKIKSQQGSSRQSLATTRKRMTRTGKLTRPGEGGDISASRAYKQIGVMLAEMFNLVEDKNWIQSAEDSIERRGTEGKCTPITKPGCTGRAKALAKTFKKMARNK